MESIVEDRFNIKQAVFDKYMQIKMDLMNHITEIFLRQHYYTHKYRGNLYTDINVAIAENEFKEHKVQIFVRHSGLYIKDVMVYDSKGLKDSIIITNIYD